MSSKLKPALLALLLLVSCGGEIDPIIYSPQPSPSAEPRINQNIVGPLRRVGSSFSVPLYGLSTCCNGSGWPQIDLGTLQAWGMVGNMVHIRLGPFWGLQEGLEFNPYISVNGRADLSRWDPSFWSKTRERVELALSLGVYIEVDVLDGWMMRHEEYSPWYPPHNIQGLSAYGCDRMSNPPLPEHERWVRKVVEEIGSYDNILWQIGNESGYCSYPFKWEKEISRIIHDEEGKRGYKRHLVGTQSEVSEIEQATWIDYISRHQDIFISRPIHGKPTQVNEYAVDLGPLAYNHQLTLARQSGTYFHYWRGPDSYSEMQSVWAEILKYRLEHP